MIELVFVIVVLGVLAVVAIPRYFGIEEQAQSDIAKAFAATLTRTVGHSFWSKSLSMGDKGSIKQDSDGDSSKFYGRELNLYVSIPRYFDESSVNFDNCVDAGESADPFIRKKSGTGGTFNIFCRDGNSTNAPYFVADEHETHQF